MLPYLLYALGGVATWAGGWVSKSVQVETEFAASRLDRAQLRAEIAALRDEVRRALDGRKEVIRVGKQAAYATAALEAYEPAALLQKKRVYGAKYAAAYERMVHGDGVSADTAYTALFRPAELP